MGLGPQSLVRALGRQGFGAHKAESFTFVTTLLIPPVTSISCKKAWPDALKPLGRKAIRSCGANLGASVARSHLISQEGAQIGPRRRLPSLSRESNQRRRGVHPPNLGRGGPKMAVSIAAPARQLVRARTTFAGKEAEGGRTYRMICTVEPQGVNLTGIQGSANR